MQDPGKSEAEAGYQPLAIVPLRHWGRWVAAAVIFLVAAGAFYVLAQADIAYRDVPKFFLFPVMLEGLWHTVVLAIAAQGAGIVIGLIIAIMRRSENPVAWGVGGIYIWIFRGVPVLLQLLIWYNLALAFRAIGIPGLFSISTNAIMSPFVAGLLGLGLNESAYMAEIIRAGFNSIDKGQVEAAQAIGMTPGKTLRRVVLPQAMRVIIPPTGNDFINMLKETSLVSVISYVELIQAANNISSHNLEVMETLLAAAIWYLVLVTIASVGQHYLERSLAGSARRPGGPGPLTAAFRALATAPFVAR
ncbi:MAG: amino acid ABC transporter permease [Acetobacteraceae bacterium]